MQDERLSNEPGRKGKISVDLNQDISQRSGDCSNKWRMTSLVIFCRPRSYSLFDCNKLLSNHLSGMFSLVSHSGMADSWFWLSIFSSVFLKTEKNIHFPDDFLLCFTPFCCCCIFLFSPQNSFLYLSSIAVHSNKNIYLTRQMFFRWSQTFLFTDPYLKRVFISSASIFVCLALCLVFGFVGVFCLVGWLLHWGFVLFWAWVVSGVFFNVSCTT